MLRIFQISISYILNIETPVKYFKIIFKFFAIDMGFEPTTSQPTRGVLTAELIYLNNYPKFKLQWILLY